MPPAAGCWTLPVGAAGGRLYAQLVLGGLDEETAFVEFGVDCDANIILGYDWLRAHDLAFLYDPNQACRH